MLNTQEKLGNSLLKNLIGLRESKGEIRIEDVGALLQGMASSLQTSSDADRFLKAEIEKMADFIISANTEIHAMVPQPDEGAPKSIKAAGLELTEVVRATEEATNTIMDVADNVQKLLAQVADAGVKAKISEEVMRLYDACSFQDITGQRINKVTKTLQITEERIVTLVQLFGGKLPDGYNPPAHLVHKDRPDESLMGGPQLTKDAPSQDDIDKLFGDL